MSAALAASILAADVVLLILFLNPEVELRREAGALALAVLLPYVLAGTAAFALVALLVTVVRGRPRPPHPLFHALPFFTLLTLVAVGAAAALFWGNLFAYRYSIPLPFLRGLFASAVALTLALLILLAVGVDALLFPSRSRGASVPLVVLAAAAAIVLPLASRPAPAPAPAPVPLATETVRPVRRVVLVGMDGLGPRQLEAGLADGSLAALGRILRRGAHGPLATLRPTEGPPIWTTIVTGRLPRDHGLKSFATYRLRGSPTSYELLPKGALVGGLERLGLVTQAPVTSTSRHRRALWNILNAFGIPTGMVRIWGTYPPERVQGFMLSHYFHVLRKDPARAAESLYPRDLLPEVTARAVEPGEVDRALVSSFIDPSVAAEAPGVSWRRELLERALAPDLTYHRAGAVLRAAYDPPFFATYYYGLDVVGHAFTRFAAPERFGDVSASDVRKYGRVVERYAAQLAQWAAELELGLRPGEILIVVSGYGMEPVPLWRRALFGLAGEAEPSGTHARAPDGVVMAVGDGIRPGALIRDASVLDLAPTILYLMGLPVARDMEGRVFAEIVDDEFARAHPLTFIPSYESLDVTPVTASPDLDLPPLPDEGS